MQHARLALTIADMLASRCTGNKPAAGVAAARTSPTLPQVQVPSIVSHMPLEPSSLPRPNLRLDIVCVCPSTRQQSALADAEQCWQTGRQPPEDRPPAEPPGSPESSAPAPSATPSSAGSGTQ